MADLLTDPSQPALEQTEEELRRKQEELARFNNDFYEKLYTDDAALAKEKGQFEQYSDDPVGDRKIRLNWGYLETLHGRDLNPSEYEIARDQYSNDNFGKPVTDDNQFYTDVRKQFEATKERNAAATELYATTINAAIKDQAAGTRTSGVEAFLKWKEAHPDISVTADDELKFFGIQNKARDDIRAVAPQAARIWDVLNRVNNDEASEQDLQTFAGELASMRREDRQKAINYAIVAAQAETGDTSKIKQAALNLSKSFSQGFGFMAAPYQLTTGGILPLSIPALAYRPLIDIEQEAETRMDQLRRSDDLRTSPEKQAEFARAQQTLEMAQVVRDLRYAAEQFSPVKPVFPEGTFRGEAERAIYGAAGSTGYIAATAVSPMLGLYAIASDEYDTMRRENPDANPHVVGAASAVSGVIQTAIERSQLLEFKGMSASLIGIKQNLLGTLFRLGTGVAKETAQELVQRAVSDGIPLVMSHLREDMPDQNAAKIMQSYVKDIPQTFYTMLAIMPVGMFLGGRVATFSDSELKAFEYFGFSPEQVRRVAQSADPAAAIRAETPLRKREQIEAGLAKLNTDAAAAKALQNDPNLPTVESAILPDGEREWRVIRNPVGESQQTPKYLSQEELQGKTVEIEAANAETGTIQRQSVSAEAGQGIAKRAIDAYTTLVDCLLK